MAIDQDFNSCTIGAHRCKCFDKLSNVEKQLIEENAALVSYGKGEFLCKQGSLASTIMYIESGLAKVFIDNGNNALVLKIIPEGNFVGLTTIAEGVDTFQYSAKTYVDSRIKQIDRKIFIQLINQNAAFARDIMDILASNSIQIYGRFFCLTHKQSYGKLADILLCLKDRIFKRSEFVLPLTRTDLAELTNMSSETVVRMLKKLDKDGLIKIENKNIKIIDYKRLMEISRNG